MLSQVLLDTLRYYYKAYKPKDWLFEGQSYDCYSAMSVQKIFQVAKEKTGILKRGKLPRTATQFRDAPARGRDRYTYHSRTFGA